MTPYETHCIAFFGGCAFAFLSLAAATWMLNTVDTWWGHRQHRALEEQKFQPPKPELVDAVGDHEVGFKP